MDRIEAVLFDFDGTLWDCEPFIFQAYDECFRRHGHRLSDATWLGMMGTAGLSPWGHLEELTGGPVDRAAAERLFRRRKTELLTTARARAGIRRLLDEIDRDGLRRAIVSNSDHAWITRYAAQCGIADGWAFIECADGDLVRAKPAPDLYRTALTRLGLEPEQAVAIEDSPTGIRAAQRAGLRCIAVRTLAAAVDGADAMIESFDRHDLNSLLSCVEPR
ncbi:HAD family hydrolase [Actinoplanes regularis]|uniref:HAD family hydrolase n=1 Tax=Actinoplanes regularis TaxID=52697 RepID=UPI0024A4A6B0|nr:HAD family phosphatase [Actinoplanes regularis]GLW28282.1 haloacid dehalogenase [Actinoplanes regularis]